MSNNPGKSALEIFLEGRIADDCYRLGCGTELVKVVHLLEFGDLAEEELLPVRQGALELLG